MAIDAKQLHSESFVMDGLSLANLDEEYVTQTLPNAGVDAIRSTVDTCTGDDFKTAIDLYKRIHKKIEQWPNVHQARSVSDLHDQDGLSIVLGFQDTSPLEDDAENVRIFDQLGIKVMQLTYNYRNLSGNGRSERADDGLSYFGLEVIESLEKHNILVDLSHVGEQTAFETVEAASQPVVLSHSNSTTVYDHRRNASDELMKAVVETGGTVGINAYPDFVGENPTLDDLIDHLDYIADLVGVENVTLGLDFIDNRDDSGLQNIIQNEHYSDPPYGYPTGLESAAKMPNITQTLVNRGYSETEIQGILGENLLRVYEDVWGE